MTSVGEDFPHQQEIVRKLWGQYVEMGPKGKAAAAALEELLEQAAAAQSSGDVVEILRAYGELLEVRRVHEVLRRYRTAREASALADARERPDSSKGG